VARSQGTCVTNGEADGHPCDECKFDGETALNPECQGELSDPSSAPLPHPALGFDAAAMQTAACFHEGMQNATVRVSTCRHRIVCAGAGMWSCSLFFPWKRWERSACDSALLTRRGRRLWHKKQRLGRDMLQSASPRSHAAHQATPRQAAPLSAAGPESRPGSGIFVRYHSGAAHSIQSLIEWARDSAAISLDSRARRAGSPTPATHHSERGWKPVPQALHSLRLAGFLLRSLTFRSRAAVRLCHNRRGSRNRRTCRSAVAGGSRAGGGQARARRSARRCRGPQFNAPAGCNFEEIRDVQFGGAGHEPLVAPVLLGPAKTKNNARGRIMKTQRLFP
jgi:hypothetical protein